MPEMFSANGSHDPFLTAEDRRRMTEENRARAEQNSPRTMTDVRNETDADRLARYRQSASNLRAAAMGEETMEERSMRSSSTLNDAGFPRGARGGFSYVSGANAYAPWQEEDLREEERWEPEDEDSAADVTAADPRYDDAWDDRYAYDDTLSDGISGPVVATARRFRNLLRSGLRRTPLAAIRVCFLAVCALALLGGTIYGKVMTNEIYTDIAEAQAEYDDLKASNVSLRSEIDGKTTVKNVEEYAEDVLGLMQLDDSQIKYIKIQTEDEVMIAEPEQGFWEKLQENFRQVWAWLRGA
ncbi:MAG: hypothetical protein IJC75_03490 [Oscillospiraceae bacterium]|nr:hypothetical protein [Oscillospiraceae bacterium]